VIAALRFCPFRPEFAVADNENRTVTQRERLFMQTAMVCSGQMTLHDAQVGIASNWERLYQTAFRVAP
jgi:hypothetical protein